MLSFFFFFFSSRRRHTRSLRDWSSDVCSSDLRRRQRARDQGVGEGAARVHGSAASQHRRRNPDQESAAGRFERAAAQGNRGVQGAVMAKPRELKRRIRSVQNTKKITKTMELVSTSKL